MLTPLDEFLGRVLEKALVPSFVVKPTRFQPNLVSTLFCF